MKVYKAKVKYTVSGMAKICEPGELVYESDGYVNGSVIYKPHNGGYPLQKETVENNPDKFEFIRNDRHKPGYYLDKKYTQFELDKILKRKNQK